ncbi:MAG: hypothetical protein HC936_15745 [Leptolyngbyaceae cyanobacterium SU_3_3]|nr:hypothetical protein [Leptolyngbyaceae cyanobacterium SU_3_3]
MGFRFSYFVAYSLFARYGYGNDDDTYRMLNTWNILITQGQYVSSRFQGYLIPEMAIGLASNLGGFLLANLTSVLLSIASLAIFYKMLSKVTTPAIAVLSVFAIASNPFWVIASATSIDYIYAVFFFVCGLFLLVRKKFYWAGLFFAAAVSSRITYGPMAAIAFCLEFFYVQKIQKPNVILIFRMYPLSVGLWSLLFTRIFCLWHVSFFFRNWPRRVGGFLGIIARFIYKNIYFWGLPAFILLVIFCYRKRKFLSKKVQKRLIMAIV